MIDKASPEGTLNWVRATHLDQSGLRAAATGPASFLVYIAERQLQRPARPRSYGPEQLLQRLHRPAAGFTDHIASF